MVNIISKIRQISRFRKDGKIFSKFVKKNFNSLNSNDFNEKTICIVVQQWYGESVPWFSITLSLLLRERTKNNVIILFDDLYFGKSTLFFYIQKVCIEKVLRLISPYIIFKKLSSYQVKSNLLNHDLIAHLASLNSIHYSRGEANVHVRNFYVNIIKSQLSTTYSALIEYFSKVHVDKLIIAGGIWGSSGIFLHASHENNIQVMTYDSAEDRLLFSTNGVAAQLSDISEAFSEILLDTKSKKFAIYHGKEQLKKRRDGNDYASFFNSSSEVMETDNKYYLMLLNLVWDSAALGINIVYENMIDWIVDTTSWVLQNTDKKIVIRQHPVEKNNSASSSDSYRFELIKVFGDSDRIVFIEAGQDVNTYGLIEKADCILGFSSTSIVEAVALGRPAIIVSDAYYENFGIVYSAKNKDQYYYYMQQVNNNKLEVDKNMRERAYICNYLTQTCNWIATSYTPLRSGFLKWSEMELESLIMNNPIIRSIDMGIPASLLKHKDLMKDALD